MSNPPASSSASKSSLLEKDLNKVSEEELKLAKSLMNKDFERNQIRPGDPGYVYDKRVQFKPTQKSNWDDSEEDDDLGDDLDLSDDLVF